MKMFSKLFSFIQSKMSKEIPREYCGEMIISFSEIDTGGYCTKCFKEDLSSLNSGEIEWWIVLP